MKTAAWEAAPQIALRNCSKGEVGGKSIYKVLVKTEFSTVRSLVSEKSACNAGDLVSIPWFDSWVGKIPWRKKWQSTPVLLPGKSHGRRSLVAHSPWGRKELDRTERLHFHFHFLKVFLK